MNASMLAVVILLAVLLVVGGSGALAIWRMEVLRRRATSVRGVRGVVVEKRTSQEHAELNYPFRGVGGPGIIIAPGSHVLGVQTSNGRRDMVVDPDTYMSYNVGDAFP